MTIYKNVHFRIETPSYCKSNHGVGFNEQQDKNNFHNIVLNLFLNDGWKLKKEAYSGGCNRVVKDKQELYLHPQDFSGVVIEKNIPYIEQLINNSNAFSLRWTDVYEEIFDITDEEYMNMLKSKKKYIEQDILEVFKTKRSNLYITSSWDCINRILNKYRIKRLSHYTGAISSDNPDIKYFFEIFEELVNNSKIVTAQTKNGIGYRTAKDKDNKKKLA